MAPRTIVIVGGALAGPVAAARARETDDRAQIVLLERASVANYSVGGIAQIVSGESGAHALAAREKAEELRDAYRVDVRTGVEATELDAKRKSLKAGRSRLAFDALIYAGGVESIMPAIPGLAGASNVARFRTPADADLIHALRARGARRAVVIGGGSLGVAAADALARADMHVTLLERHGQILSEFSPVAASVAVEGLAEVGAGVVTSAKISSAEREGDAVTALIVGRGRRIACDLVIVAAGARPRTDLLVKAGAKTIAGGALRVDDACLTSLPDIHACGTCVALPGFWDDKPAWIAQAAVADRTAQVAGSAAAGGLERMGEPFLGTMLVRAGTRIVGRTGLSRAQAARALGKREPGIVIASAPATDPMVTAATPVLVELRFDPADGTVVGGDVAGGPGADKRLDALAMGLHGVLLTATALAEVDLGHDPPLSPVRDPLNVAGTIAASCVAGLSSARTAESLARARVTLVDVRPAEARGGAKGARRIPLASLRERLKEIPASRPAIFVDEDGRLGYLASRIARGRGRKDAGFLTGGLRAWRAAGLPVEKDPRA